MSTQPRLGKPFELPQFTFPRSLGALAARLPQFPPTLGLVTMLNIALGRILPRETLEPLLGKLVCLIVTDAGLTLRFTLTERGFRPAVGSADPDLSISARTCDFLALALRQEDPDTLFFSRRLVMEGDTDLGLLVKNTLDAIDLPRFEAEKLAPSRLLALLKIRLLERSGRLTHEEP